MKKRLKTIQSSLFFTYSFLIIIILLFFVSVFYIWISNVLKERAFEAFDNLTYSFQEKLNNEIQKMDDVSMNIMYSNLVKRNFEKYISYGKIDDGLVTSDKEDSVAAIDNSKELIDMLTAINGPSRPVQQIYLYDFKGKVFGTGFDNRQQNISVADKVWFNDVMDKEKSKVITLPHKDPELTKFVSQNSNLKYISLCRIYFDKYNTPQGIVEVKQSYDTVLKTIIEYMNKNSGTESIYIYDKSGNVIYPQKNNMNKDDGYYFKYCNIKNSDGSSLTVANPITNDHELLEYKYSDYTGWIIAVAVSEKKLLEPVVTFAKIIGMLTIVTLFFSLLFSYFAARKYTDPIGRLRRTIKEMDLQESLKLIPKDLGSGLIELEELNHSFIKMNLKVKNSVEYLLMSQQHENRARMLALQSQMNPHFLYNTLTTISVMAEDGMDEQITEMCVNVSDMLRYISSDKFPLVQINMEIEYTQKYLACMKIRYGNKLSYSIDIDKTMMDIYIPKLIIQPLVENSLKFGTNKEPPWDIKIYGQIRDGYWNIEVQDNGPGFNEEKLKIINKKIKDIDQSGLLPSLEIEGMGLLNIYIRLKLVYKNGMTFKITENQLGGTIIIIGGSVDLKEDKYER